MQRRNFVIRSSALAAGLALAPAARATFANHGTHVGLGYPASAGFGYPGQNSIVVAWNRALTSAIAATRTQATIAARAFSMLHEAIYNAWAVWDMKAYFTLAPMRKRSVTEAWAGVQAIAISRAAYVVLADLFPTQLATFESLRFAERSALDGGLFAGLPAVAREIGTLAGTALLQQRHHDGSNQLGDLAPGAYSDTSGYVSVNTPDSIVDISSWQPLRLRDASGATVVQKFLTPHWGQVRPFALSSGSQFRPAIGHRVPTWDEMNQLIEFSAALDDTSKALVHLWAANPGSESPPGQWMQIAEQISAHDHNSLDKDVKLFFATAQGMLDASIAAWDTKRAYDTVRPFTAIPYFYRDQSIVAWAGFNRGRGTIPGQQWRPYQREITPTPPFPEYVSGHSTFSATGATVIAALRLFGDSVTITGTVAAGGIAFETDTPRQRVTFTWPTLSEAAAAAGLSRRVGGIHFEQGDLHGRALGRKVGNAVLARCQSLFGGLPLWW